MVAALRLIPHPPNFAPIGTLALFACSWFADKRAAFLVPLAAMLVSDLGIGPLTGDLWLGPALVSSYRLWQFCADCVSWFLVAATPRRSFNCRSRSNWLYAVLCYDQLWSVVSKSNVFQDLGRADRVLHRGHSVFPQHFAEQRRVCHSTLRRPDAR